MNTTKQTTTNTSTPALIYLHFLLFTFFRKEKTKNHRELNKTLRKLQAIALLASLLSVVLSGYRVLILATLAAALLSSFRQPKKLLLALIITPACVAIFIYLSTLFGANRVIESITLDGALSQLSTRYAPAFDVIASFTPTNYLLGAGFGTVFEIDWFGYRSLDTTNNFVDSAYITFFAKYGLAGIFMLSLIVLSFRSLAPTSLKAPISIYLLTLFIVYAISYQAASAGMIVGCILISNLNLHLCK
ncbi:DUF6369 family protein [Pseudomonas pseudonitroreducens]|uniref:DUF6369 family protein n=1 Tax=Pseudomonas pseudonitroreducens TaxID=2892326 RepID=UPI001F27115A|nr:DUF6369 family protein [Pseudomonas pseudonitroreducens]